MRSSIGSIAAFALAFFLAACGDDDSGSFVEPSPDESSSSIEEESSSSVEDKSSSSSVKDESSSSSVKDVILSSSEGSSPSSSSSVKSSSSKKGDPGTSSSEKSSSSAKSSSSVASSSSAKSSSSSVKSSSSVVLSSSTIDLGSEYDDVAKTLKDLRDNQIYRTATIGTQTWMAENLNFETEKSFCYDDVSRNCAKYGRLYTWAEAMDSVGTWSMNGKGCGYTVMCSPTYPVRGVCPKGWHLPTKEEWDTLFTAVGGSDVVAKELKSTNGWSGNGNGLDTYAFSALPGGYKVDDNSSLNYEDEGDYAYFWSSTEKAKNNYSAYYLYLRYNDDAYVSSGYKCRLNSVRCVKD